MTKSKTQEGKGGCQSSCQRGYPRFFEHDNEGFFRIKAFSSFFFEAQKEVDPKIYPQPKKDCHHKGGYQIQSAYEYLRDTQGNYDAIQEAREDQKRQAKSF